MEGFDGNSIINSIYFIDYYSSSKADGGPQIISGGQSELFANRKERGSELVITRITMLLGAAFFIICLVSMFI